jgi:hypothetical protein
LLEETPLLPCQSNFDKSKEELIHELEINHERVASSSVVAQNLTARIKLMEQEQSRQWHLYQMSLTEKRELGEKLTEARKAIIDQSDLVRAKADALSKAKQAELELHHIRCAFDNLLCEVKTLESGILGGLKRSQLKEQIETHRRRRYS